ncbi:MAG: efflux RND transporter permease subunit [Clostridia bacterium]|nr:efflux RND transporter permease subunit [Clostridia bacterium]
MKLSALSVRRPIAATMAVLVFVVIGLYSLTMLPLDLMPEMKIPVAMIITQYENVGAEAVENLVTKTVEGAVSSVSGVDDIVSQSSEGISMVMVQFASSVDIEIATQNIKDNLSLVESYLPEEAQKPIVLKLDTSMIATAQFNVTYEGYDLIQTKQFVDDNLINNLESAAGVASVSVAGAEERQIDVVVDPEKMFGYDLTLSQIMGAIALQNQNLPAGAVDAMGKEATVRTLNQFKDIYDIEAVPVTTPGGQTVYLRDIASVSDTYSEATSYARDNGAEAISISITKESDANTVDVVTEVLKQLDSLTKASPKFSYSIIYEQASYIQNAVGSVAQSAVLGAILAILVLLLFLGSVKTSLVIGITMPISVITTFIGMYFAGMSLNVVSLGGLSLGVGMLVDNAIVVIENIFRRRNDIGEDRKTAAISGASEVVGAVVASVLTTCIVYVPILFIDNIVASMFQQIAFTIIFSQIAALLVTFLLIPMLSSRIRHMDSAQSKAAFIFKPFEKFLSCLYKAYEKALRAVLKKRKSFLSGVLAVFIASLVVLGALGMTLMPETDEGTISVSIELPKGSTLESVDAIARRVESAISQNENVETVFSTVGSNSMSAVMGATANTASITVTLKDDREKRASDIMEDIRASLSNIAGGIIRMEIISTGVSVSGMASDEVEFSFTGDNDEALMEFVLLAEQKLKTIPTITETSTSISDTQPEIRIVPNVAVASHYGLTASTLNTIVSQSLSGATASRLTDNGKEYDIVVKYPKGYVTDYSQLQNLRIKTPIGAIVSLKEVADVELARGSTTLNRVGQKRTISLTGKFHDDNIQNVTNTFNKILSEMEFPDGVGITETGTYEIMMEAISSLFMAIILGIILMYMIMAAQFESFREPFIILFTIPLAIIGVVLSLAVTRSPLSVVGCIGILMLVGIIVNNAIVLIDFIKTLRKERPDDTRTEIIVSAGLTRMRPILMTSLTSILGFMPMALSRADGAEMMRPLAVVLLGGLAVGALLTLLVIPVIYTIFDDKKVKMMLKKKRKSSM